jgi:hypothetical protein
MEHNDDGNSFERARDKRLVLFYLSYFSESIGELLVSVGQ